MTENGKAYLVDAKGFSLYRFDKMPKENQPVMLSAPRKWPPALASDSEVKAGVDKAGRRRDSSVLRDDGRYQWSYRGPPLYRWIGMSSPARAAGWREECLAPRPTVRSE